MELFVFLSFLSLFSVLPALAQVQHTYWVDQSCSGADITAIIEDAMNMAKRGTMRLNSGTDSDYAKVFERIFKAPKTDQTAFNKVNGKRELLPSDHVLTLYGKGFLANRKRHRGQGRQGTSDTASRE